MKKLLPGLAAFFLSLLGASALADSWAPPRVETFASADGAWKLTIYPRGVATPLAYFKDKVDGNPDAGGIPGDTQKSPIGHMQHKRDGHWETVWKGPLVNDVSPVEAVVSNSGESVTFDNWHGTGWGDDAVVVYAADGNRVREFGLADFLPKYYIDALPHSVSSIHWRGKPHIDEAKRQLVVPVVVPTNDIENINTMKERHIEVRFRLSDGSLLPMDGNAWGEAVAAALEVNAQREAWLVERRKRFVSPLAAPVGDDVRPWYDYLQEAFFRVDPDWEDGYPNTSVVPPASDPKFKLLAGYVGDELTDDMNADDVIMLAAVSQDILVNVLAKQASRVKPGFLAKARVYVAADNAHMPAVRAALANTGANVIQLDIDATIPQRQERLDRYLRDEAETGE
jgi:hypothetical protein